MAYLVIEINTSNSIEEFNDQQNMATKKTESLNGLINLIASLNSGTAAGTVQIISRDSSASVGTSGSGSASNTFTS